MLSDAPTARVGVDAASGGTVLPFGLGLRVASGLKDRISRISSSSSGCRSRLRFDALPRVERESAHGG